MSRPAYGQALVDLIVRSSNNTLAASFCWLLGLGLVCGLPLYVIWGIITVYCDYSLPVESFEATLQRVELRSESRSSYGSLGGPGPLVETLWADVYVHHRDGTVERLRTGRTGNQAQALQKTLVVGHVYRFEVRNSRCTHRYLRSYVPLQGPNKTRT